MTKTQMDIDQNLRHRAEKQLKANEFCPIPGEQVITSTKHSHLETLKLNQELRVHQVELEMQNEEMRCYQNELEISRTRYFDLYDLAPIGYITLSNRWIIQQVNFTAATILGVVRSFLINRPLSQIIFTQDRSVYNLHSERLLENDEVQDWEMRLMRADGSLLWVHIQAKPANGGEYLIAFDDITKRKNIEEELELLHKNLETRVVEMIADLRRKDQAMIQQNSLATMGEMISNIAHQWRQPLNTVGLIYQDLLIEYDSGTLTREDMHGGTHDAMEVLLHMSQTIDDFRSFFRNGKDKKDFFISEAVNRAVSLVSATLKSLNILVEIKTDDDVTFIGHQNEYSQVLLNIISNSCDVCRERSVADPRIFFRITKENKRSVLYIRDNCGGILDGVIPKIFDLYFTTRGPDKGTGIGLYMSKMIIEQNMDGHLTASNVDGGAEFRIEV